MHTFCIGMQGKQNNTDNGAEKKNLQLKWKND